MLYYVDYSYCIQADELSHVFVLNIVTIMTGTSTVNIVYIAVLYSLDVLITDDDEAILCKKNSLDDI